jgi:hypothetical protein
MSEPLWSEIVLKIRQGKQKTTEADAQVSFYQPALSLPGALDFCFNNSNSIFGWMFVLARKKEKGHSTTTGNSTGGHLRPRGQAPAVTQRNTSLLHYLPMHLLN